MNVQELNGWLVYGFGGAVRVAICPGPGEEELVVLRLLPEPEAGKPYPCLILPAQAEGVTMEQFQKGLELTARRAEAVKDAFLDALAALTEEEEEGEPPPPVIPIRSVPG